MPVKAKPGIRFPKNERTKSAEAKLTTDSKNQLTTTPSSKKPKANENINKSLANSDGKIKLTSSQISLYLNLDTEAKTKFSKYYSFRSDRNLELDQVETEWQKLTALQKTQYNDQAIADAQKLSEQGLISYNVDQQIYDQIISQQVIT